MSTTRISQRELESYLWGAAVVLRGLIDAGDYKQYIFPLVFLKRISDVYDEEHAAAMEIYGDEDLADLPENHRFAIPDGCHWNDIRSVTQNIGATILKAMRAIESANPDTLPGVFGDGDWGNKDLLPDSTLADLIEHFSSKTLSIANLPEDELGNGYEYLIKKFADDSGHTAQEFYTNRTLVHLMTLMLEPQPGESVYDPTCGTGGMLISAAAEVKRQGKEWRNLRLYGQELNYGTSAIARMNLFLHGITDGHIAHGDTLARPAFLDARDGCRPSMSSSPTRRTPSRRGTVQPSRRTPTAATCGASRRRRRRLRLLPAHRQEPCADDRPSGGPLPTWRARPLSEADVRARIVESDPVEAFSVWLQGSSITQAWKPCRRTAQHEDQERQGKVLFINAKDQYTACSLSLSSVRTSRRSSMPIALSATRGFREGRHYSTRSQTRATAWRSRCMSTAGCAVEPWAHRWHHGRLAAAAESRTPPSAKSSPCCERRHQHEPQP